MEINLKKSMYGLFAMLILLGGYIYGEYLIRQLEDCLDKTGVWTKGKIIRSYVYKGNNVEISFKADGKTHIARDIMYKVFVGDSVFVYYCKNDPTQYKTFREDPREKIKNAK